MNLHRIEGKPEWAGLKKEHMNVWQRVAAGSGGILTIGNYFSLLGLLSVPFGLSLILGERYIAGVIVLLLGRLCDLLDGFLADKTGTKSPLGEKVDAVFDKLSTGLALFVLALSGLLAWWVVVLLIVPHIAVAWLSVKIFFKGSLLHPSLLGKLSMAAGWLAMLTFVLAHGLTDGWHMAALVAAYGLLIVSVGMAAVATHGYYQEYRSLVSTAK